MKLAEARRASLDSGGRPCLRIRQQPFNLQFGYQAHLNRSVRVSGLLGPEERRETSSLATSVIDGGYDQLVGGATVESRRTDG